MPEEGLTLTAKFYATYTLAVYCDDGAGNYPDAPNTVTGKSFFGEAFAYAPGEHYTIDASKQNACTSASLGKNETFTVWLLREAYTVTYLADAPKGVSANVPAPAKAAYGLEYTVGSAELLEGSVKNFRFRGWSAERNGSAQYTAGDVLPMPTADVTLYAVWEKGLTDAMGGDDVVFLPADEPETAYLQRNGYGLIRGDYSAETRIFTFKVSEEKAYAGRASANGDTFAWYDADAKVAFSQYDIHNKEIVEGETLALDGYDGATYTPADGEEVKGVYSSDGNGILLFSAAGKEFFFRLGEEDGKDVFYVRDKVFGTYFSEDGSFVTVDGFGSLTDKTGTYDYTLETDEIVSYSIFDEWAWDYVTVRCKLVTEIVDGVEVKTCIFEDKIGGAYEADDGELVLDGFGGATYTPADGEAVKGSYSLIKEDMDEDYNDVAFITVSDQNENLYAFKLTYGSIYGGSDTFEAVGEELGEYETLLADGDYTMARLLLDGCGNAEILFYFVSPDNGEYYDTAFYGIYQEENGAFRFTLTETDYNYETTVAEYEEQFSDFLFKVGELNGIPYFSQFVESSEGSFSAQEGTLVLDGFGTGTYTPANGVAHSCIYMTERTLVYLIDTSTGDAFYLRLNGSDFRIVGKEAGTYYLYTGENGGALGAETLFLDGEGNAVLTGSDAETEGKYTSADGGAYTFTATDKVFLFKLDLLYQAQGAYRVFTKQLEGEKIYSSEEYGMLIVDPFGSATWIDGNSKSHVGLIAEEEGILYLFAEQDGKGTVYAFAVLGEDGAEFALIGDEYGVYFLLEKGVLRETKIELDGHGGAKLYEGDDLLSEGTYEAVGGTGSQFIYTPSSGEAFRFTIGSVATNDGSTESVYVAYHEEWDFTAHPRGEAWESLVLDGYNTAYYTDERGFVRNYEYETLDNTVIRIAVLDTGAYLYYRLNRKEGAFSLIEDDYVLSDDGTVLLIYRGSETSIALPDTIVELGEDAFYNTKVTDVDLNHVEIVGESAFDSVATLATITAPKVKSIGALAFFMNVCLTEIDLPSVETIGEAAFRYCESLSAVTFGPNLRSVEERAFLDLSGKGTRFTIQSGVFAVSADDPETTGPTENENSFEENALFEAKDLRTAFAFYAADGWKSYAAQICLAEETPATFYTVSMSEEFTLDGQAKKNGEPIGVYKKTDTSLSVYPCDGGAVQTGAFAENVLTFGGKSFLPEGTEVTFTGKEPNETLAFRLGKGQIPATYNGESVTLTVGDTIVFEKDHYAYTVTLSENRTFTTTSAFAPYTATYTCGSNGSLSLTFKDEGRKNVAVTGSSNSIKIAGRALGNFGTISFGTPEWKADNVYEIAINSTATQNGTRSLPVVYKAVITLNDEDNTFTYTSSIEYSKVPLEGKTVELVVSYDKDLNVSGVSLAFGDTEETVTYTAEATSTTLTLNITVASGEHAGSYTAKITHSTSALTLTKNAS